MTQTLPHLDAPGDAELISAVRGGDVSAYGPLFERHVEAARRLARQLVGSADADDLVSDAFAKVLRVLQGGGGPDVAFRAYLLTAVRRLHVDKIRANSKLHTTGDLEPFDPGVPFRDTAVEGFESAAAAKAFASLPERWQAVLWHTEVEGQKPADVAVLLGMTPNSVSALAYRAREGLRQAFLSSHIAELDDDNCTWTHEHLGSYIRNGLSKRDAGKVEKHIDECRGCMGIYLELTEVNSNLGGILAPLLLGSAGAGYLAASSVAAKGGVLVFLDRAKETLVANTQAAAVAGVAAAGVVAGGIFIAVTDDDSRQATADGPGIVVTTDSPGDQPSAQPTTQPDPTRSPGTSGPTTTPVPSRSAIPGVVPTTSPTTDPTQISPSESATQPGPSEIPTSEAPGPSETPTSGSPNPTESPTTESPTENPTSESPTENPTSESPTENPTTEEPTGTPTTNPQPEADLMLTVDDSRSNPVHARFNVKVTRVAPAQGATLEVAFSWAIVDVALVTAPDFCEVRPDGMTCDLPQQDSEFEIQILHAPLGLIVTMELTPDAPYVDPTPNRYSGPSDDRGLLAILGLL